MAKVRLHRAKGMLCDILKSSLNALEIFEFRAKPCALMAEKIMRQLAAARPAI